MPKENKHYTCIACTTTDSVMRMEKKYFPQVYLEECKHRMKKRKMTKFIEAEIFQFFHLGKHLVLKAFQVWFESFSR